MSGAIGVTPQEQGARGLWFEKRRALFKELQMRGHKVKILNRMTMPSTNIEHHDVKEHADCDVVLFEFGSNNARFYGEDLKDTEWLAKNHAGPKVFLCDDPDLPFVWDWAIKPAEWTCWYNAKFKRPFGKEPIGTYILDFPFSSLQDATEPVSEYQKEKFVYIGRPKGRERAVADLIAYGVPWRVYGKGNEWAEFGMTVHQPPNQPDRAAFYAKQLGSLVLADKKHKELGWRTGRAYHAVLAGCPAVAEIDHNALIGFDRFGSPEDLLRLHRAWQDPDKRAAAWNSQIQHVWYERKIADEALQRAGL